MDGKTCGMVGEVITSWETGDSECDAVSTKYDCGGIYHNNYMDIVGNRNHDCFWDCRDCEKGLD